MKLQEISKTELVGKVFNLLCKERDISNPMYFQLRSEYLAKVKKSYMVYNYGLGVVRRVLNNLSEQITSDFIPEVDSAIARVEAKDYLAEEGAYFLDYGITETLKQAIQKFDKVQHDIELQKKEQDTTLNYLKELFPNEFNIYREADSIVAGYYPKFNVCKYDTVEITYEDLKTHEIKQQECQIHFINKHGIAAIYLYEGIKVFPSYVFEPSENSKYAFKSLKIIDRNHLEIYWKVFNMLEGVEHEDI